MIRPTLTTRRLVLRPFELTDAAEVTRLVGDRRIADTTLNIPHPYDEEIAVAWIGTHAEATERGEGVTLAATEGELGALVGAVGLTIAARHRRAELGYWVAVEQWGRGYATEAARAMVDYAFRELGLNRVDAHCLTRNVASSRVMEKVGMQREGCLRSHIIRWDVPEDIVLYGILREEWERLRRESDT
ncbi:MAG: GNAT family N-acetyltransferase [Gemmatimonadaceae bacterium]